MSDPVLVENNYKPTRPAKRLHSSTASIIVCVGGVGSGKSFSVVKEVEQSAVQWERMPIAIYRKTMPSLRDSTLHEFKEHVDSELGEWRAREDKWEFHNGSFVNFRGLDEPTKAKSTNYGLIVMEEAEEFTFEDFQRLNERVRSKGPWPLRLILVLNPVDEDHWIYQQFAVEENAAKYRASGGLEVIHWSTYDNIENLPDGYIERVSSGKTPEEIDRYINGQWGTIVKGAPVYAGILNPAVHLWKMPRFPGQILRRGWDFGFNHPAVSFRLVDQYGRMNIAHAHLGSKIHLEEFVPIVVNLTTRLFGHDIILEDFGDPRGHDNSPNGKETCFEVLADFGIHALGERGSRSYVESGIKQVKKEFSTLIKGIPELTIDPGASLIRAAYFGRYVRDEDGTPKKDGYYEHVADADRYISHHHEHHTAVRAAVAQARARREAAKTVRNRYTGYGRR